MANWIPFILMTLASLLLLCFMYIKKKTPLVFFFWLSFSGLAYIFEFIVFILMDSYYYRPNILDNAYNDNLLGSISSQALAVPIAVTFFAIFKLKNRWIFFFIGIFALIEVWFLYLGIYHHHWWKTYYTSCFLIPAFLLGKRWYRKLITRNTNRSYLFSLIFALGTIVTTIVWVLSSLFHLFEIQPNFFEKNARDLVTGNFLYFSFVCVLYSFAIYYRNGDLISYSGVVIFLLLIEFFMTTEKIMNVSSIWVLPLFHYSILIVGGFFYQRYFPTGTYRNGKVKTIGEID